MRIQVEVGDVIRIVFLDHSEGTVEQKFELFGRVHSKDRKMICVVCWGYADDQANIDDNTHCYTILRSTIIECDKLRKVK